MAHPLMVVGHRNPDTDSVCSSIAYARYKTEITGQPAVPYRAGNLNAQTRFALDHFKVAVPDMLPDAYPRIRNIMIPEEVLYLVRPEDPIAGARTIMLENRFSFLPVIDEKRRCVGRLTALRLAGLMDDLDSGGPGEQLNDLHLPTIADLGGSVAYLTSEGESAPPDSLAASVLITRATDLTEPAVPDGESSAGKDSPRFVIAAECGEHEIDRLREWVRRSGTPVLAVSDSLPQTAAWARLSRPVSTCLEGVGSTFHADDTLHEVIREVNKSNEGGFIVLDPQDRICGVVTRMNFMTDARFPLILMDHNELSQAVDGAEHASIMEVIDHHRIGGRSTAEPITFLNRPVGSTCTIVADLFRNSGTAPGREIAGLLISGLLSDTIILRSPTCTPADKEAAAWLAPIAGISIEEYGERMFEAGSDIRSQSAREILERDMKYYEENGVQFSVSQVEMIGFKVFWDRSREMSGELAAHVSRAGLNCGFLMVTDITSETTLLVAAGEERITRNIAYPQEDPGVFTMAGVLSRKKQVLPYLVDLMNEL